MRMNVSKTFAQQQARYNRYFEKKVRSFPVYITSQTVFVNRSPSSIFSADRKTFAKYNKLMLHTPGPFQVAEVRDHVPDFNGNCIANTN